VGARQGDPSTTHERLNGYLADELFGQGIRPLSPLFKALCLVVKGILFGWPSISGEDRRYGLVCYCAQLLASIQNDTETLQKWNVFWRHLRVVDWRSTSTGS
jgi:hypothetical protein